MRKKIFPGLLSWKAAIISVLFLLSSLNLSFAQCGWNIIYSQDNAGFQCIYFVNSSTGYAAGPKLVTGIWYPYVLKTTNAGISWFESITPLQNTQNLWFRCVYFIDQNTGFLTYANSNGNTPGGILRTTNGGANWTDVVIPLTRHMTKIYFLNALTGYASGSWMVIKTTNAGVNWDLSYYNNTAGYLFAIDFTASDTGYVVGNYGSIRKTVNAGLNWELQSTNPPVSYSLWGVDFINSNTGIVVGGMEQNFIFRTTNAGENWNQIFHPGGTDLLWAVKFINSSTGFITGYNSQLLKTTNGGANWFNRSYPDSVQTAFSPHGISFINGNTGYIAGTTTSSGYKAYILKTTTCGDPPTGIMPVSTEIPSEYKLYQNYPNPFNPSTKIKFEIPLRHSREGGNPVLLKVFDILGKEVATLVNEKLQTGTYEVTFEGSSIPSGVYFYKLNSGNFNDTKKMLLIK